jgi:hypothetical protein
VEGPAPGTPRPLSGLVAITDRAGNTITAVASPDGTFSAELPVGRYTVSARSPLYQSGAQDCQSVPPTTVEVATGGRSLVTVVCEER